MSENSTAQRGADPVLIEYNGRVQSRSAWAREIGITGAALKMRIEGLGWTLEKALTTPKIERNLAKSSHTIDGITDSLLGHCRRKGIDYREAQAKLAAGKTLRFALRRQKMADGRKKKKVENATKYPYKGEMLTLRAIAGRTATRYHALYYHIERGKTAEEAVAFVRANQHPMTNFIEIGELRMSVSAWMRYLGYKGMGMLSEIKKAGKTSEEAIRILYARKEAERAEKQRGDVHA